MSALTPAEKIRLSQLNDHVGTLPASETLRAGAVALADFPRSRLPDLDDVTMGRLALALGDFIGHVSTRDHPGATRVMDALTDQIMCAGLDLTAVEWQDVPR